LIGVVRRSGWRAVADDLVQHRSDPVGEGVGHSDVGECAGVEVDPFAVDRDHASGEDGAGPGQ
jgi:hypothetical protein